MNIKISAAELEVMRLLWREDKALSYAEIREELESKTEWNKSTIQTLVGRLRNKGIINAQKHYVTLYSANITEDEYIQSEGKHFIKRLFNGSAKKMVSALCKSGDLSEADIDELKNYFRMGENKSE